MSTYFLLDPFEFPYYFYRIRGELIYALSMFLICSASRICSFCLLFWCSNIVVLSVRIFRSCVVGHECFFKCWAIELVSERCIVSLLDRVVEVKPTYILLLSEIQSLKGHLNLYITLVFCKALIEGEELISGEYVFVNQYFQYFFIGFVIVVHLVTIKKFDICLLIRFSKHYILETCNQHLIELIFKPVLMYLNVFSYWY